MSFLHVKLRLESIAKSNRKGEIILPQGSLEVREFNINSDLGRLCELWGNLCMIQQMRGEKFWMDKFNKSGLSWADFVVTLSKLDVSELIVFVYEKVVFGFIYLLKEEDFASIKEFYLEPGYREKIDTNQLSSNIKNILESKNIEFVEFDVTEL